jgi:uncharacterized membrane protein YvlD (DUF360 family)
MANVKNNKSVNPVGLLIGVLFAALISGILIWVVSLLGLGLEVDGIGTAYIAGIAIAVVGGLITWLLGLLRLKVGGGVLGAILNIPVGAVVLVICGQFLPGLTVEGVQGALLASLAIYAISWLLSLIPGSINKTVASQEAKDS